MNRIRLAASTDFPRLVAIWERSVHATHDFLTEADIEFYRPLVLTYPLLHMTIVAQGP